ncbi:7302_t:CDS:10 [Acaulospora colombiana]|uniref:7302_t:CDS:1 n=1 Tax=Acaulospora colombiana TaxID=27376 RepID=A0ACA9MG96_9GLOM|nr:7302_t:CDS:10 [Acaulospora colombiana]
MTRINRGTGVGYGSRSSFRFRWPNKASEFIVPPLYANQIDPAQVQGERPSIGEFTSFLNVDIDSVINWEPKLALILRISCSDKFPFFNAVKLVRSNGRQLLARSFHQTTKSNMRILPIPIRSDNYMYLLVEQQQSVGNSTIGQTNKLKALLVDPADPKALAKAHAAAGEANMDVDIVGILTTHHHEDHAGGNDIIAEALPSIPIIGGAPDSGGQSKVRGATRTVKDNDEVTLGESIKIREIKRPCLLGTPAEMHKALSYLGTLPDDTVVYNGHEYTTGNLKFAKSVDADNEGVSRLQSLCDANKITTGKSTIGDEKEWNVFMRLDSEAIKEATGKTDPSEVMGKLREMKNAITEERDEDSESVEHFKVTGKGLETGERQVGRVIDSPTNESIKPLGTRELEERKRALSFKHLAEELDREQSNTRIPRSDFLGSGRGEMRAGPAALKKGERKITRSSTSIQPSERDRGGRKQSRKRGYYGPSQRHCFQDDTTAPTIHSLCQLVPVPQCKTQRTRSKTSSSTTIDLY